MTERDERMSERDDTGVLGAWDIPDDDGDGWCDECCGTGELDCHCGGDICVCYNHGTYPCPHCR